MEALYVKESKYWFMSYCEYNNLFLDVVLRDSHPFEEIRRLNKIANFASSRYVLISFQRITRDEYYLFNH